MTNEISMKMGAFIADRDKLVKLLYGSGVMEDGQMLWYNGTIEALFSFIDRWISRGMGIGESRFSESHFSKSCFSKTCSCWSDGYCLGTKEMDSCLCNGDKKKCDFYGEKSKKEEESEYYYGRTWEDMDKILNTMLEIEARNYFYFYKPEEQEAFNIALMLISEKMNKLKCHKRKKP